MFPLDSATGTHVYFPPRYDQNNLGSASSNLDARYNVLLQFDPTDVQVNQITQRIYVSNRRSSSLSVVDARTHYVLGTIGVGIEPTGIALDQDRNLIYVVNRLSATVSVIDGAHNRVLTAIPVTLDLQPTG